MLLHFSADNFADVFKNTLPRFQSAVFKLDPLVVFPMNSMLVAKQLAPCDVWTCRGAALVPLRNECRRFLEAFTQRGIIWHLLHIFREYNQVAYGLASAADNDLIARYQSHMW